MKQTYVAFLRGINVGKAKRVSMADLRALVESLGGENVRTLLNSGNVVFIASSDLQKNIESAIAKKFGFESRVTMLAARELAKIVTLNPFAKIANDPSRYLVAISTKTDLKKISDLVRQNWNSEAIALGSRWAYLWCPNGILDSPLATAVNRALRDAVTARNWATILKLHAML